MIGRELYVLWSGQPDLRIEELGMAGNGWERLGTAGNGWEVVQVAPCGAKQVRFFYYNGSIHLTRKRALFANSNSVFCDSSLFQRQENRMNFISCVKTISMRISVETLPFLVTEDSDIPLLGVVMAYTAHEEALLRTQARNALLTLLSKMKKSDGQLLRTALEMAKSRKLG